MKVPIGQMHPEYQFHKYIKEMKYQLLLRALGDKKAKAALTFPGLSNFALERLLIAKYPGIEIHCFEANKETFNKIVNDFEDVPKEVQIINMSAEQWLADTSCKYDLIFLDYCTGPTDDINGLIRSKLSDDGIFATTLYSGRGTDYVINPTGLSLAIEPLHYNHMYFMGFRNSPQKGTVLSGRLMQSVERVDKEAAKKKMRGIYYVGKKYWVIVTVNGKIHRTSTPDLAEAITIRDQFKYGKTGKTLLVEPKESYVEKEVKIPIEGRLAGGLTYAQIKPYLSRLPDYEQHLIDQYLIKGATQPDIAKMFKQTQGAISSRLRVVAKRIDYLKYVEKFNDADLRRRLSQDFSPLIVDIMINLKETTCQTRVAEILSSKYGLGLSQVKVRHRFFNTLAFIVSRAQKQPEKYQDMADLFTYVKDNFYVAHEVRLPTRAGQSIGPVSLGRRGGAGSRLRPHYRKCKDLSVRVYGKDCIVTPELKDNLAKALTQLSPALKQVMELKYGKGLKTSEISKALDIPEFIVKSRLKASVKSLERSFRRMKPGFIDRRTIKSRALSPSF